MKGEGESEGGVQVKESAHKKWEKVRRYLRQYDIHIHYKLGGESFAGQSNKMDQLSE